MLIDIINNGIIEDCDGSKNYQPGQCPQEQSDTKLPGVMSPNNAASVFAHCRVVRSAMQQAVVFTGENDNSVSSKVSKYGVEIYATFTHAVDVAGNFENWAGAGHFISIRCIQKIFIKLNLNNIHEVVATLVQQSARILRFDFSDQ